MLLFQGSNGIFPFNFGQKIKRDLIVWRATAFSSHLGVIAHHLYMGVRFTTLSNFLRRDICISVFRQICAP